MIRPPNRLYALAYLAGLVLVAILSLVPRVDVPGPEGSDKFAHLIAYGAIALAGGLGFRDWDRRIMAATTAVGIGIFLEVAQASWAMRDGSVTDGVANTAGAALGLAAAWIVLRVLAERPGPRPPLTRARRNPATAARRRRAGT
jgi:VanZ family protein